jgi:fido (protein-threonine AMPylation protein)
LSQIHFTYPSGATPLDPNECNGLIPTYITTQSELNLLERENILEATKNILLRSFDQEPFSWGMNAKSSAIEVQGELRQKYISALRAADQNDFSKLLNFARS